MSEIKFVVGVIDVDDDHGCVTMSDLYVGQDIVEAMRVFVERRADCFDVYVNGKYDNDQSLSVQTSLEHIMRTKSFRMSVRQK